MTRQFIRITNLKWPAAPRIVVNLRGLCNLRTARERFLGTEGIPTIPAPSASR